VQLKQAPEDGTEQLLPPPTREIAGPDGKAAAARQEQTELLPATTVRQLPSQFCRPPQTVVHLPWASSLFQIGPASTSTAKLGAAARVSVRQAASAARNSLKQRMSLPPQNQAASKA
jgi:hypothetical protein